MSKLTLPAFLKQLVAEASARLPSFQSHYTEKGGRHLAIGREIESKAFVFVDFYGGSHRRIVGHGVGWTSSFAEFIAWQERRENDPIQPYDGSLRRLLRLDMPRDFLYKEVHRQTSTLYLPMQVLDLDNHAPDELHQLMLSEVEEYAVPYLRLMLEKRHALSLTASELSGRSI